MNLVARLREMCLLVPKLPVTTNRPSDRRGIVLSANFRVATMQELSQFCTIG
jgi:hypothetical protein